jgi:hypothetical protein
MRIMKAVVLSLLSVAAPCCLPSCVAQEAGNETPSSALTVSQISSVSRRPAEMSPSPPQVTCKGKELSIAAENSTMNSVLIAVGNCIGLRIEVPEGTANERTYIQLGPGPSLGVLQSLLSSTDYNYVIEPSDTEPDKVRSVLLMARAKDESKKSAGSDLALTPARRAWLEMRQRSHPTTDAGTDEQSLSPAETAPISASDSSSPVVSQKGPNTQDGVQSTLAAVGTDSAGSAEASQSTDKPAAATIGEAAMSSPENTVPAAAGTESQSGASKEMQDRIGTMQQLFEQRKQMIQGQGSNPAPQP